MGFSDIVPISGILEFCPVVPQNSARNAKCSVFFSPLIILIQLLTMFRNIMTLRKES